jgi:hypothetical protein
MSRDGCALPNELLPEHFLVAVGYRHEIYVTDPKRVRAGEDDDGAAPTRGSHRVAGSSWDSAGRRATLADGARMRWHPPSGSRVTGLPAAARLGCGFLHAIINREDGTVGAEVNPGNHPSRRTRRSGHARSIHLFDNCCADKDQTVSTGSGPLLPVSFDSKIEGRNALVTIHSDRVEYQRRGFGQRKAIDVILLKQVSSVSVADDGIGKSAVVVRTGTLEVTFRPSREDANRMRDLVIELLPR